ncbi:transposase [Paenibacillus sp. KS-LC4]|uniref:transposase n=1 Tax=Paenibacillus sp. KS-LC4 TaxID=2979727 RepID=UPI0030D3C81A
MLFVKNKHKKIAKSCRMAGRHPSRCLSAKAPAQKSWTENLTFSRPTFFWGLTAIGFGLRQSLLTMLKVIRELQEQLAHVEQVIYEVSQTTPQVQLLESIPGVSTKLATAIVAEIGDESQFSPHAMKADEKELLMIQ